MAPSQREPMDRATLVALVGMAAGVFLVANDFTALSVVIPTIEQDFATTLNRAQWVINGYTVVFGVLIVTGGRVADLFGRKRIFLIGAAGFGAMSIAAGLAPTIGVLIASRALMGVGAAMMWPAVLGLMYAVLPPSRAGLAGGLIIGVAGIGNASGPLIGGLITDAFGWRWVFFVNVPITLIAMAVVAKNVPESSGDQVDRSIDGRGIAALSLGVILILFALDQGTVWGFTDPWIVAMFVVGGAVLGGFAIIERSGGESALIPRSVMRSRQFVAAFITVLLASAVFFSATVFVPQYLVKELDYSALDAGLALLPMMITLALTSFIAGNLYGRLGPRFVVSAGAACLVVGMLALSLLNAEPGYWILIPGLVVIGLGVGVFYSAITTRAVTALDPSMSSLAGGIVYMAQIAGGSVGLGLNTAIVLSAATFDEGIATAFRIDAALAASAFVVAVTLIRSDEFDGAQTPS